MQGQIAHLAYKNNLANFVSIDHDLPNLSHLSDAWAICEELLELRQLRLLNKKRSEPEPRKRSKPETVIPEKNQKKVRKLPPNPPESICDIEDDESDGMKLFLSS